MAKRTTKPSLPRALDTIAQTFEKLDYQNPDIRELYAQVGVLSTMLADLQDKLAREMEISLLHQFNRQLVEQQLDVFKEQAIEKGVDFVTAQAAKELDMTPEQMRRVVAWLAGESLAEVSISYKEELRDLLIDLSEWMQQDE